MARGRDRTLTILALVALGALAGSAAHPALAAPTQQLLIAVGNDRGQDGEEPLRFAERDARRVEEVLQELGEVAPGRSLLLTGSGPDELDRAFAEARGRAAELVAARVRVVLIVYYAGHGDAAALHLGSRSYPLDRLRSALAAVPAQLRIAILDSCRTVGASRRQGWRPGPSFAVDLTPDGPRGTVVISSASAGEPAHESDELGGAVFSHYLLSGLRGPADTDRDGQVSLEEGYRFAASRTALRTAGSAGAVQHPAYDLELTGSAPVILTRTHKGSSQLVFPAGVDTRYLIYHLPSGNLLAEAPGSGAGPTTVSLPAGRFFVQRRGRPGYAVAQIDLPWGGSRRLATGDFTPVSEQQLARRGGQPGLRRTIVGVAGRVGLLPGRTGQGAALDLAYALGRGSLELALTASRTELELPRHQGEELSLGVRPAAAFLVLGRWYTLRAGGGLAIERIWQSLTRRQAERLRAAGFEPEERYRATALGPELFLRLSVCLFDGLALDAELAGRALVSRSAEPGDTGLRVQPGLSLAPGLSWAF